MSRKVNPTLIGAFVSGAIILIVLAIILFGGEGLFERKERIIMYFGGAVDGLNVGAPVNVRGVQVGTVTNIDIEFDTQTGELRVPVIAEIRSSSIDEVRKLRAQDPLHSIVEDLGLRAQLQLQSVLTSQLFIQLDYHPETSIQYFGDGSLIEIPTIPMKMEQLDRTLDAVNRLVNTPDLMDTITAMKQAFISVDKLSRELGEKFIPRADIAMNELTGTLNELELTLKQLRELTDENSPQIRKLNTALDEIANAGRAVNKLGESGKIEQALTEIAAAARMLRDLENSPEMYNLNVALEQITDAARALQTLADTLEQQPEALIRGKSRGEP